MLKYNILATFLLLISTLGCGRTKDYIWEHGGCTIKDGQDCEREQDNEKMGPTGTQGPMGQPGVTGKPGQDGSDGESGTQGVPGDEGHAGVDGSPGTQGEDGSNGLDGDSCTIERRDPVARHCGTEWREWLVCPDNTEAYLGKVCE